MTFLFYVYFLNCVSIFVWHFWSYLAIDPGPGPGLRQCLGWVKGPGPRKSTFYYKTLFWFKFDLFWGHLGLISNSFDIITEPADFDAVKEAIDNAQIEYDVAEITMLPQNYAKVEGQEAEQICRFMEALDDSDDVQKFYSNADIPDEVLNSL